MGDIGKLIAQFLLALGILIGFLYVMYIFLKRRAPFVASRDVQVLQRHYVDRNISVVLIKILDEYYYLLVSHSNATVLKKLSEQEVARLEAKEPFSKILFKRLSKARNRGREEEE